MQHVYTGLDIGNDSIKLVVVREDEGDFYVLGATSVKSVGIKKNNILEEKKLKEALLKAVTQMENSLGMQIEEVILCVPANTAVMTIESGFTNIKDGVVDGDDIYYALQDAANGTYGNDRELVFTLPISFTVDSEMAVLNPKGENGSKLLVKTVVATSPKLEIYPYISVVRNAGINIRDIIYNTQADYYTVATHEMDRKMGAIINVGADITTVAIFNKGIMIKNSFIPVGSTHVDKDISYVYKVDLETARKLKETFALTVGRYADVNDEVKVKNKEGKLLTITQVQISKVIESRVGEILKLAKNEINHLTKREISYIIVVGGISEQAGFNYLVEEILGRNASCYNMQMLGARHNKYTSAIGSCKYFHNKATLEDRQTSMFDAKELNSFLAPKKKSTTNDLLINRFFEHFFKNN